jgi:hypothetical protein
VTQVNAFCTKAVNRLKAGPSNIQKVIDSQQKFEDTDFTKNNMVYWDGDTSSVVISTYTNQINIGN